MTAKYSKCSILVEFLRPSFQRLNRTRLKRSKVRWCWLKSTIQEHGASFLRIIIGEKVNHGKKIWHFWHASFGYFESCYEAWYYCSIVSRHTFFLLLSSLEDVRVSLQCENQTNDVTDGQNRCAEVHQRSVGTLATSSRVIFDQN